MKKSIGKRTLLYPTPVLVIGTYGPDRRANMMTASWGGICCSSPPCVAVSLRQATYSYGNITERQAFTINIPSEAHLRAADYFGIASGRGEDKVSAAGLTAVAGEFVDAPYLAEFPVILECKVIHTLEIGLHTQFIGEILDVKAEESVLSGNVPDIEKIRPFLFVPESRLYYGTGSLLGKAFSEGKPSK